MRLILIILTLTSLSSCTLFGPRYQPGHAEALHIETKANDNTSIEPIQIRTPSITITVPAGHEATISTSNAKQPNPPDQPATAKADDKVAVADSGNAGDGGQTPGLGGTLWIGIGLIIVGVILFLAKRAGWARFLAPGPTGILFKISASLPPGTGIAIAVLGGGLIVLPWFLDTIQPMIIPAVSIIGVLGLWWVINMINNRGKDQPDSVVASEARERGGVQDEPLAAPPTSDDKPREIPSPPD